MQLSADHVALVTGGASGLGLATVHQLAAAGARVVIVDLPSSSGAQIAEKIGTGVVFCPADIRSEDDIAVAVETAAAMGRLSVLVNCAGGGNAYRVAGRKGPFPLDAFRAVVELNLVGTFNVIRLAAQEMISNDSVDGERGVIVTTASVAAFEGQVGQASYSASKAGLVGLTLPLARDLASSQVRVVTVAPGMFNTPLLAGLTEEALADLCAQVPHPARLGEPSEFAALVLHIVENPMINGETIRLDGAIRMRP
jgi:NAD(P)-dependent dehydrogenase (short-subunit alcohol dehydrogenase family)